MANKEHVKEEKKAPVPVHHGRFPFEPGLKKPAVLKKGMGLPRIYGSADNLIGTYTHASTDKIHVSEFTVLPGRCFDPPDIHVGDEVYYVKKGECRIFNPETGRVLEARQGDFVYIPAGTWHQMWNFAGEEVVIINWIAPQLWSEKGRGTSISFDGKPAFYCGGKTK